CFALSGKECLKRIQANYADVNSLEVNLDYKLYKGYRSNDVKEYYSSIYQKSDHSTYRKIGNNEFITDAGLMLTINHVNRTISVSHDIEQQLVDPSIKKSLKFCKDAVVRKLKNGDLKIELLIRKNTDLPYARVDIHVDRDFWIKD